jgi:hypothetical protein
MRCEACDGDGAIKRGAGDAPWLCGDCHGELDPYHMSEPEAAAHAICEVFGVEGARRRMRKKGRRLRDLGGLAAVALVLALFVAGCVPPARPIPPMPIPKAQPLPDPGPTEPIEIRPWRVVRPIQVFDTRAAFAHPDLWRIESCDW